MCNTCKFFESGECSKSVLCVNGSKYAPIKNKTLDSYGRQDLDTTGSKEAYYITNGYAIPITARKDSRSSKTIYTYMDGSSVKLNDGNTFIQIEPINMTPSFE